VPQVSRIAEHPDDMPEQSDELYFIARLRPGVKKYYIYIRGDDGSYWVIRSVTSKIVDFAPNIMVNLLHIDALPELGHDEPKGNLE
jgi:hypothetical protein